MSLGRSFSKTLKASGPSATRGKSHEEIVKSGAEMYDANQKKLDSTPITTWDQAQRWYKESDLAKLMPVAQQIADLNWSVNMAISNHKDPNGNSYVREDINKAEAIRRNPLPYVQKNYADIVAKAAFGFPWDATVAAGRKSDLDKATSFLIQNKVPIERIQADINKGLAEANRWYEHHVSASKPDFMDYVFAIGENLIVGGLTGGLGLSPVNAAALNSALAIANGADVQEALKAGLAGLAANQVGSYLQGVSSVVKDPIANAALTNAAQSAATATVLGQDPKKAALAGLAGGAVAGTLFKASDNAAISRAAGEYTQAVAAGQSPEMAMMSALTSFADSEMDQAKRKIEAEAETIRQSKKTEAEAKARQDQVVDAFTQPKSPGVGTPLGDPTAELSGGVQSGSRTGAEGTGIVRDVDLPSIPVKPVVPSDRDTLPTVEVPAPKLPAQDVASESAFLDELKKAAVSGDLQSLIDVTQKAELPAALEAKKFLELVKPESEEFKKSLLKLPTQDLRDLTGLLSAGATEGSPFYGDALSSLQKNFDTAEANASELLAKATTDPTTENLSAATKAQNDALTAKFKLSQALLMSETDTSKADLSGYNKYPDATNKFIDDGQVVYAKGAGTTDSPVEILGSEPYSSPELKFLSSTPRPPATRQGEGSADLEALKQLSLVRGQPLGQNLRYQMDQAKVAANEALVALQSTNTPETVQAARDALANYELSQKMYTQVAGEETTDLPDEKLASQEFPLVDEAVKTGQMMGLSPASPANTLTPLQKYQKYKRLSGQKEEENYLGDAGLGISVLPRFEGLMEPQMFARGGLTALRRM